MRASSLLIVVLALVTFSHAQRRQSNNRYDNFNADAVVGNERIMTAYYKCVMDIGPCTKDGRIFKSRYPSSETILRSLGEARSAVDVYRLRENKAEEFVYLNELISRNTGVLPDTLSTACALCSPKQKSLVRKLLLGIRAKSEQSFHELLDKYNPDLNNRAALYSFLITGQ